MRKKDLSQNTKATIKEKLCATKFSVRVYGETRVYRIAFPNGYGAVINTAGDNLYELDVLQGSELCFIDSIEKQKSGLLCEGAVVGLCTKIASLNELYSA